MDNNQCEQSNSKKTKKRKRSHRSQTELSDGEKNRSLNHQEQATGATNTDKSRDGNLNHNAIEIKEKLRAGEASRHSFHSEKVSSSVHKDADRESPINVSSPNFYNKKMIDALNVQGANDMIEPPYTNSASHGGFRSMNTVGGIAHEDIIELKDTDRETPLNLSASSQYHHVKKSAYLCDQQTEGVPANGKVDLSTSKKESFDTSTAVGFAFHACLLLALVAWRPAGDDPALFHVISAAWGVCNAIWETLIYTLLLGLHPGTWQGPLATSLFWRWLGLSLALGLHGLVCTRLRVLGLAGMLLLSVVPYAWLEVRLAKRGKSLAPL